MLNHTNARNYREPFYLIKYTRNNDDGLSGARQFVHFLFFGSIMQDKDLSLGTNERPGVESLSIKILNTSHTIELADLIYRNGKLYQIVGVDKDQYNRQETKIRATYISEIETQSDAIEYLKTINTRKSVAKPKELIYNDTLQQYLKNLKAELLEKMEEFSTDLEYEQLVEQVNRIDGTLIGLKDDYVKHSELEAFASVENVNRINETVNTLSDKTNELTETISTINSTKADNSALTTQINTLNANVLEKLENYTTNEKHALIERKNTRVGNENNQHCRPTRRIDNSKWQKTRE
ncbi:hypothetical protein NXS15_01180 [Mycoplasma sp. CSL7475-4]|uniref:hypothetical protein n=1 Tax=Mycoplasma sp. CSL7475-4 TaxID=2973942 RepID=UPI00216AF576|nr:hypothetical protein [Mycoplasma sp. CSL7475-4]MCS4536743.1 hypothetical protein [Mycoplasma sp. CSL7475-4]